MLPQLVSSKIHLDWATRRRLALVLAVVTSLALASGGAARQTSVGTAQTATTTLSSATGAASTPVVRRELPSLRSRDSRTYLLDNGNHLTEIAGGPINFRDERGAWQPIDNRLKSRSGGGFENTAGDYRVELPANLSDPVRITKGAQWISFALVGAASVAADVSGSTATYRNAFPGVDVRFEAGPQGVKEALVLRSAAAPKTFTYAVQTSTGLTPRSNAAKGLEVVTAAGNAAFTIAPAYMFDQAKASSSAISITAVATQSGYSVTLAADPTWISRQARSWPITIDPTFGVTTDCSLSNGADANTTFCGYHGVYVGYDGSLKKRGILKFDTSSMSPQATILTANLRLYLESATSATSTTINAHGLTRGYTTAATWNKYDGVHAWSNAGGDFNSTVAAAATVGGTPGWNSWNIALLVREWVNQTAPNNGVLLKQQAENVSSVKVFKGSEYHDDQVPVLVVEHHDDPAPASRPEIKPPAAPSGTFTINQVYPGLALTIITNGGIWPSDVSIRPAREYMGGRGAQALAGPAFDITVPSTTPAIQGATLTLPYQESRLGGVPENDLRIYKFDKAAQLWVKVPGAQTVNTTANTVTVPLTSFSVYAVLKTRSSAEWAAIFGTTPVRCVSSGSVGVDVAFLVDSSGSMGTSDPTGKRVDGAKLFVDAMRPASDRAAVVDFDSIARILLGLTALSSQSGIDAVKAALEQTRNASGGTDISAAVQAAITILSQNGGGGRLRVAILLTDGQSSYNTALTTQAAQQAIEIHTVGLGSGVNAPLLQGIATGTGGSYRFLANAADLPALYQDLVGDIIDDGTDSDADTLTNCVETNGMFVPLLTIYSYIPGMPQFASFITTNPQNLDTDGDTLPDGGPNGEMEAKDLRTDPAVASEYQFLIDAGLTTYYVMKSDPNKADTDGDGFRDDVERTNGTNPFVNNNELGIEGLNLPAFTLFQPNQYLQKPAILAAFVVQLDGMTKKYTVFNNNPVRYDGSRNCVENCTAVQALAAARPNDNGWEICVFGLIGNCVTDESQIRDIIEEARSKQGIFDANGLLASNFMVENLASQCANWYTYEDPGTCAREALSQQSSGSLSNIGANNFAAALAAGTIALPAPGRIPNPELIKWLGAFFAGTAALVGSGITAADLEVTLRECYAGSALSVASQVLPFIHPCEEMPLYSPGGTTVNGVSMRLSAIHRVEAITANPLFNMRRWADPSQRPTPGWYIGQPGCTEGERIAALATYGVPVACDEYPNAAMLGSGPPAKSAANPTGTSLKYLPAEDNGAEGSSYGIFLLVPQCKVKVVDERRAFLVIPIPDAVMWSYHCGSLP